MTDEQIEEEVSSGTLKEKITFNPDREEDLSEEKQSFYQSLKNKMGGVKKTLFSGLVTSLMGDKEIDEDMLDEIEERLLVSDIGVHTTRQVIKIVQDEFAAGNISTLKDTTNLIRKIFLDILKNSDNSIKLAENGPTVIMLIGVNGTGKTTSIGKLAKQYMDDGKKVMIVAGDTFRAAAIDQLKVWSERSGAEFYTKDPGSDPSAVMFEATRKAVQENFDVVLCDTSGRLHTKKNLMDELEKMKRVISKNIPEAPHYSILTLDASSGQNAVRQAKEFKEIVNYEGLILTKLDGSSKGGVIIGIINEYKTPIFFVGLGEKIGDLHSFDANGFISSIFDN